MMTRDAAKNREQMQILSLDDLVPKNHLVRKLENALDWSFIYDLVEEKYSEETGRPSLDPVTLIKLPVLQYMFGIRSMRQTVKEVEVNAAYRWFLGLDIQDPVPHFSTFGKNYTRRFKNSDLFEQIFKHILSECFEAGLVDSSVVFVDSTHVKARANSKKYHDEIAEEQTLWYEKELLEEINRDREAHDLKPLKDKEDNEPPKGRLKGKANPNTSKAKQKRQKKEHHRKISESDPESGWFRKGEHKNVFAYSVQTACDKNGVILGYNVHPGNENDGRTFPELLEKIEEYDVEMVVGDTAYKTPAIAKKLHDKGIKLLSTYKRPMTKEGFFKKDEFAYDEYYDCYVCPNNEVLSYHTTNREGYREYWSDPKKSESCPYLARCTESKQCQKTVTRHVWAEYLEEAIENEYTPGIREWYKLRKETIERDFGIAKEFHGFRYTQEYGRARMSLKSALTFACLNLKKLAKKRWRDRWAEYYSSKYLPLISGLFIFFAKSRQKPLPV